MSSHILSFFILSPRKRPFSFILSSIRPIPIPFPKEYLVRTVHLFGWVDFCWLAFSKKWKKAKTWIASVTFSNFLFSFFHSSIHSWDRICEIRSWVEMCSPGSNAIYFISSHSTHFIALPSPSSTKLSDLPTNEILQLWECGINS